MVRFGSEDLLTIEEENKPPCPTLGLHCGQLRSPSTVTVSVICGVVAQLHTILYMTISATALWSPASQVIAGTVRPGKDINFSLDEVLPDIVDLSPAAIQGTRTSSTHDVNQLCNPLSESDKALVKNLTGWDATTQPDGPTPPLTQGERNFILMVSLDRAEGTLTGDVTPEYISNFKHMQMQDPSGQILVPDSILEKALSLVRNSI